MTQMAFGAVVGQAGWRRRFGRRAMAAGALIALAPDLDVLVALDPLSGWLYHRGLSHSVVAGPFFGLALGLGFWLYYRWRRRRSGDASLDRLAEPDALMSWLWLGVIVYVSHAWLDLLTPYGTQLFAPLSNTRFAVNAMPIIDLTYTLILVAALIVGLWPSVSGRVGQALAGAALMLSLVWQFHGWDVNARAEIKARADMRARGVVAAAVRSYPSLLTPWLRRINVETADKIYIGYWSLTGAPEVSWQSFTKKSHPLVEEVRKTRAFRVLHWFALEQVFWRVHELADGGVRIEAHDLRYLQFSADGHLQGLWGIAQEFDAEGAPLGDAFRWTSRPDAGAVFDQILSQTFTF